MSCGIGHRHGWDLELLWLWNRLAAVTLIRPLAWETPYATGAALKRHKKKKRIIRERKRNKEKNPIYNSIKNNKPPT